MPALVHGSYVPMPARVLYYRKLPRSYHTVLATCVMPATTYLPVRLVCVWFYLLPVPHASSCVVLYVPLRARAFVHYYPFTFPKKAIRRLPAAARCVGSTAATILRTPFTTVCIPMNYPPHTTTPPCHHRIPTIFYLPHLRKPADFRTMHCHRHSPFREDGGGSRPTAVAFGWLFGCDEAGHAFPRAQCPRLHHRHRAYAPAGSDACENFACYAFTLLAFTAALAFGSGHHLLRTSLWLHVFGLFVGLPAHYSLL